jgi:CRISPR-associated protein Cmr2
MPLLWAEGTFCFGGIGMTYLISIAIGPVQDFINTARRSRDLWFGSWLLSELSKAVAHEIVRLYKAENLIFPNPEDPSDLVAGPSQKRNDFSVVNKIVAIVPDPEAAADAAEKALRERLDELAKQAFTRLEGDSHFCRDMAFEQVNDLPEFYWAAYPLANPFDKAEYKQARAMTEALLASRKTTRCFAPATWGSPVPKSSLDGQREAVIKEGVYKQEGFDEEKKLLKLRRKYGLRSRAEHLCGVGLLKRLGQRGNDDSFFSTSHVAALPLIQQIQNGEAVAAYIATLRELDLDESDLGKVPRHPQDEPKHAFNRIIGGEKRSYDGHLLFEGRLSDFFDPVTEKQDLEKARTSLRTFLKTSKLKEPLPYYAIMLADGDRMGATIDHQETKEEHQQLSRCLSQFAAAVRDIVEKDHQGWVVYAGGDDVLAFAPLHKLIECARALADKFADSFTLPNKTDGSQFADKDGKSPTLSMGIAIAHHLDPLSDALDQARRAEKLAKAVDGKDALAIIVSKRSGPETLVKGHWNEVDARLQRFTYLHRAEAIPDGAAYDLQTMARELEHVPGAISVEAKRILGRKRAKQGTEGLSKKIINELMEYLGRNDYSAQDLARELIVARLLAQATEQADIKPEELAGAKDSQQEAQLKQ